MKLLPSRFEQTSREPERSEGERLGGFKSGRRDILNPRATAEGAGHPFGPSGAAHSRQKVNSPSFSAPHCGQVDGAVSSASGSGGSRS